MDQYPTQDEIANQLRDLERSMKLTAASLDLPPMPVIPPVNLQDLEENLASDFFRRLTAIIRQFDQSLDNEHEVGVRLVNFGSELVFHLTSLGYMNPSLIVFRGVSNETNDPIQLIQHVSQISVLLMKLPRLKPTEPKKPFGFDLDKHRTDD